MRLISSRLLPKIPNRARFSSRRAGEKFAHPSRVQPLVSFIIPVRNDAERLRRCLTSIVANDYPRELIELIVVDNNSTDASARAAREFGSVVLTVAGTVAELRNRGARAALGSILAFVDADHEIDRGWIAHAVDALSDATVAAAGAPYVTDPCANWVQHQYDGLRSRSATREDVSWLGSGNLAIKRAWFERVHGFNQHLTACEDVDLCNRLQQAGARIVADPALRSVHFGDPKTLRALFLGELWRGRDNLTVTFRGPKTLRNLRSALIPVAQLLSLIVFVIAVALQSWWIASLALIAAVAPAAARAAVICQRKLRTSIIGAAQAFTVAIVYDFARALAIVLQGSHRARRSA